MRSKTIVVLLVVVVGLFLVLLWVNEASAPVDDDSVDPQEEEPEVTTDQTLSVLPYEITVGERRVMLDTTTVSYSEREVFNEREDVIADLGQSDPVAYVEDRVSDELLQEHIQDQPSDLYQYSVSFYSEGEGNVTAFVRVMGFPDDSVGGSEERYDFVLTDGRWELEWYGDRQYCRRMDNEFWAEPGELCP